MQAPVDGVPLQDHVLGSVHRHRCLTCPSVPADPVLGRQRPTRLTSARFHGRAPGPVSGRLYETAVGGDDDAVPLSRYLSATGIRFLGVLFPPGGPALLTVGLPATLQASEPDPDGVPTFHTHEIRPDRVSSLPRGRRCSYDHRDVRGRRLPPHNGRPLPPQQYCPTWDVMMTRHRQGFSAIHPLGLPFACDTRSERAPLGFPLSFAPSRCQPRTSGQRQVWNTDPSHVFGITPNLQSTNLLITCDLVSHRIRSCRRSGSQRDGDRGVLEPPPIRLPG